MGAFLHLSLALGEMADHNPVFRGGPLAHMLRNAPVGGTQDPGHVLIDHLPFGLLDSELWLPDLPLKGTSKGVLVNTVCSGFAGE